MRRRTDRANGTRSVLLLLLSLVAVALCGCDNDHDGYDDQTGQPVTSISDSDSGHTNCPESGVRWLQPDYCRSNGTNDGSSGLVPDEGVSQEWLALVARHEAGHKAVADEYGWRLRSVKISTDGSGYTKLAGFGWPCKCPVQIVAYMLGGEVASGMGSFDDDPSTNDDWTHIEKFLADFTEDEAARIEDDAYTEADRIVTERSAEIDRDAATLLRTGRLDVG